MKTKFKKQPLVACLLWLSASACPAAHAEQVTPEQANANLQTAWAKLMGNADKDRALWAEVSQALLQGATNFNLKVGSAELTPIHIAAFYNDVPAVQYLLEKGTEVNTKSKLDITPLHQAAQGNAPQVASLLIDKGADLKAKNYRDWTPLHTAALNNSDKVLSLLLEKGSEINAKAAKWNNWMPLHMAAAFNATEEVTALLLGKGADVKAKANDGRYTAAPCSPQK